MVGGEQIVIQFRIQPLDAECFRHARSLLGHVVPDIIQLHDEELDALGLRVYAMSYMPGQCWVHISPFEDRIKIAASLGNILGRGRMQESSTEVVDSYVLPCLQQFHDSIDASTEILRPHVNRLIAASPRLKRLPLYFSHHDLNEMNVLVEDATVSGIVDWECARGLPFGMGLHRVTDTIAAANSKGKLIYPKGSDAAEKAFWDGVMPIAPAIENIEDVQTSVHTGSLIFAFTEKHIERAKHAEFLARLLTYRLPQLRGDADAFAPEA